MGYGTGGHGGWGGAEGLVQLHFDEIILLHTGQIAFLIVFYLFLMLLLRSTSPHFTLG